MPGQPLPDDINQWPTDPYRLLGIHRDTSSRDARRAYVRLIRQFKPEHAPEQFKRIREAFDRVQGQLEIRALYEDPFEEDDVWSAGETPTEQDTGQGDEARDDDQDIPLALDGEIGGDANETPAFDPDDAFVFEFGSGTEPLPPEPESRNDGEPKRSRPIRLPPDFEQTCAEAWRMAKNGFEAEAYAKLVELLARGQGEQEISIRLYWLLTAAPEIDPRRSPCDWLTRSLRAGKLSGPAWELYRREIARNRQEACSQRCHDLLTVEAPPHAVVDLADSRWRAFSYLQQWQQIVNDLPKFRELVVFEDEESWGRILLLAIDQLAWFREHQMADDAFESCRREIDELSHLHSALESDLDRMDLLLDLVTGWRKLKLAADVPRGWNDLIPLSWTQNDSDIQAHLLPVVGAIAERPFDALDAFDKLMRHSTAVAGQLGSLIMRSRYLDDDHNGGERDWEDVQQQASRFHRLHPLPYRQIRRELLKFCIEEVIDPEWVGQIVDEIITADDFEIGWSDAIANDGPIRYVYAALRSFWG